MRTESEGKGDGIDFLSFLHSSFHDTELAREVKTHTKRLINLLVHVPLQKLVLVIENKFHAGESDGQLADYLAYAKLHFPEPGYMILPIFLTLANEETSEDNYLLLGYEDVLGIIEQHLEFNKGTTADDIHDFLSFYIEVLKEQLVHDEEAVQLALEVYEGNKSAIDFLFLSQNKNFKKQAIYKGIFQQIGEFSDREKIVLCKIYESKKKTIDLIFNIGSNVLRVAFLEFVKETEIPEEAFSASIRSPNFVLPDWFDFEETLAKPDSTDWLGQTLIIWFERQVENRIKVTVEVGPIPCEERYQLLSMLEKQGINFQQNAKQEGKKYTKIYTARTEVNDWASKQEVLKSMLQLYNAPEINDLFRKTVLSVEEMAQQEEAEDVLISKGIEQEDKISAKKVPSIPRAAFQKFCSENGIK